MELHELIPEAETLLILDPEQVGGCMLRVMNSRNGRERMVTLTHWLHELYNQPRQGFQPNLRDDVYRAIAEAWNWLEVQGLLVWPDDANGKNGWRVPSRRGEKLTQEDDVKRYLQGTNLPRGFIHPRLRESVWLLFLSGDYDTAVFKSFKEVEVSVRRAAELPDSDYGVTLIRKAFDPQSGRLTDSSLSDGQREALSHLFAGALGYYKNPQSHLEVGLNEAAEARELVMLASHLLRILDKRQN